jgi:glucokinase
MGLTIGVDIGGTKIAAGVVDEQGQILARARRPTPSDDPGKVEDVIADAIRELALAYEVEAVGLGAAGFVGADRSTILFAPNLAWRREPLREAIERRLALPAVIENDANAAAWAEVRFGAAAGELNVVVVTVGTGIGGGIVVNGELVRGRYGLAAEIGHLSMVPNGRRCGCGNDGCWEQYASGRALVAEARALASRAPQSAERMLKLAGGLPGGIDGPCVTTAAREGDEAALEAFRIVGTWLGRGIADLAAALDPAVFVLAGGVSSAGELLREPAWQEYMARLTGRGHRPSAELRVAQLGGDEAGIIGAADLARQPLVPPPP